MSEPAKHNDVDLSHHLSTLSKSRQPSPLKDIVKYMFDPEMTSLAGGLPHPSIFPFLRAEIEILPPTADLTPAGSGQAGSSDIVTIKRDGTSSETTLSRAMQYTGGTGDASLTNFCHAFVKEVYKPARDDFQVLLSSGSTDAWAKVVQLLCEPGEHILVEQFVYPSAQSFYIPMGCKGVPIAMDGEGMIPSALEDVLKNWESAHPGVRRPHVLYQVPVGHNPCGTTLTWHRKQEIYSLACRYDIIIVEDDPYYWLQFGSYVPNRTMEAVNGHGKLDRVPSYLQLDTQARVIRLETFSKTIAPGLRLGFFVTSPLFVERLIRATEVGTQAPSGWSQAIVLELLRKWGTSGYLTWLESVKDAYNTRRDWMCDALLRELDFDAEEDPERGLIARVTDSQGQKHDVMSFVPPKAGMFLWIALNLRENPGYKVLKDRLDGRAAVSQWSRDFWLHLLEKKVLLTPGSYYEPWQGPDAQVQLPEDTAFFRMAYSYESREDIESGVQKFACAIKEAWSA